MKIRIPIRPVSFLIAGITAGIIFANGTARAEQLPSVLIKALKEGNAIALSPFLAEQVELTLPDQECTCTAAKTQQLLSKFFSVYPALNYYTIHEGNNDEYKYAIGMYTSTAGKYRFFILLKESGSQNYIHQIRIDKTDE